MPRKLVVDGNGVEEPEEAQAQNRVTVSGIVVVVALILVLARCDRVYSVRDGKILREIIPKAESAKRIPDEERLAMDTLY